MNNAVGVLEKKYFVKRQANQALFPSLRGRNIMIFQHILIWSRAGINITLLSWVFGLLTIKYVDFGIKNLAYLLTF